MEHYTSIPVGDIVLCDSCNADYTDSEETGGILFHGSAYCPKCAGRFPKSHDRCPDGKSFADWVRQGLRSGRPTSIEIFSI